MSGDRGLKWMYRLFPKSWHTRPMHQCRHPYCWFLNRREHARVSDNTQETPT